MSAQSIIDETFNYDNLVHAISGMTGGVTAISVFFPLNSVRLRIQIDDTLKEENALAVARKIVERDGASALYQGWWSAVVSLGCSNFVYFFTYNAFKSIYRNLIVNNPKAGIDAVTNLAIASAAGVINVLATTPLWVAGTRLAVQSKKAATGNTDPNSRPYDGIIDCLARIVKNEGLWSLWKGVLPSLVLVSNPSIQFVAYERLRAPMAKIAARRGYGITSVEFFVMGAIAKAVATVLTYPLQIAQSKLRADKGKGPNHTKTYNGTVDVLTKLFKKDGYKGWFQGMQAKLWQTVLTAAFQFLTYEKVQALVFAVLSNKDASKAVSQTSIVAAVK